MPLSRRLLLTGLAVGGGLAVVYVNHRLDDGDARAKFGATTPDSHALNAWLKISPDGAIVCGVHRAEMGQGVTTSLPMLLAEELDADWSRVQYEFTPLDRDYFNFGMLLRGQPLGETDGRFWAGVGTDLIRRAFHALGLSMTISSTSTVDAWDSLRPAGAAARAMLLAAAARRWEVPVDRLQMASSTVTDPATGLTLTYGELAADAARERPPRNPILKDPSEWRLLGRSLPRLDVPEKITGRARYGVDTRWPGILHGAVRHGPFPGARLAPVDETPARTVAGVEAVIPLGERAVAVLAGNTWTARRAADRLRLAAATGETPPPDSASLFAAFHAALDDPAASVFRDEGGAPALLAGPGVLEARYELPYLAHACMEPMSCAAWFDDGVLTIRAPTQAPTVARDEAARATGLEPRQVQVEQTHLGGGFGRRAEMDFVVEAALAAMAVPGRPVQLAWSREEDIRAGVFRPAAVGRLRGALDDRGLLRALDYTLVSQSVVADYNRRTPNPRGGNARRDRSALSGALDLHYAVPAVRMAYVPRDLGLPAGFWRSVSHSINPFLLESFVDELAAAAGADPLAFRLAHLEGQPRARAVLESAARRSGWGEATGPGRGRGLAFTESHETFVAHVVQVRLDGPGGLRVERIDCVIDCRSVIHPDNVVAQVTGSILDGLNAALQGEITVRDGRVEQGNFRDYPWLRLAEVPEIRVELLPQGGRPGGVGEPALPGVAPALANAIVAAGGPRLRRLPLIRDLTRSGTAGT